MPFLTDGSLIEISTLLLSAGSAVIGLFIAFLALRALRRHRSRQMLYLSGGMILLFGAAYSLAMIGTVLIHYRIITLPQQDYFIFGVRALQFLGLLAIAYSMLIDE